MGYKKCISHLIAIVAVFSFVFLGLSSEASTELSNNVNQEINSKTSGRSFTSSDVNLFTKTVTGTDMARNKSCWACGYDFTGVSPYNSWGWSGSGGRVRGGTLITPKHAVYAAHFKIPINTILYFVDNNNVVHQRKVIDTKVIGSSDSAIARLESPLPASVTHYPMVNSENLARRLKPDTFLISLDQDKNVFVTSARQNDNFLPYLWKSTAHYRTTDSKHALKHGLANGDSGQPTFIPINGKLHLVSTHTSSFGYGPNLGNIYGQLQSAISGWGDSERISVASLSQFQESNIAPALENLSGGFNIKSNEHRPVGTVLFDYSYKELNTGQTATFSLSSNSSTRGVAINSQTGELYVSDLLAFDYEKGRYFTFDVIVTDSGNPPLSHSRTVQINFSNISEAQIIPSAGRSIVLNSPRKYFVMGVGDIVNFDITIKDWIPADPIKIYQRHYDSNENYLGRSLLKTHIPEIQSGQVNVEFEVTESHANVKGQSDYVKLFVCGKNCPAGGGGTVGDVYDETDEYVSITINKSTAKNINGQIYADVSPPPAPPSIPTSTLTQDNAPDVVADTNTNANTDTTTSNTSDTPSNMVKNEAEKGVVNQRNPTSPTNPVNQYIPNETFVLPTPGTVRQPINNPPTPTVNNVDIPVNIPNVAVSNTNNSNVPNRSDGGSSARSPQIATNEGVSQENSDSGDRPVRGGFDTVRRNLENDSGDFEIDDTEPVVEEPRTTIGGVLGNVVDIVVDVFTGFLIFLNIK